MPPEGDRIYEDFGTPPSPPPCGQIKPEETPGALQKKMGHLNTLSTILPPPHAKEVGESKFSLRAVVWGGEVDFGL